MAECEAERRNKQALYILENEWGCGRIDVGRLQMILRGNEPDTCPVPPEDADAKFLRGERKSLLKLLDGWEREGHTTVTIRFLRQHLTKKQPRK